MEEQREGDKQSLLRIQSQPEYTASSRPVPVLTYKDRPSLSTKNTQKLDTCGTCSTREAEALSSGQLGLYNKILCKTKNK